MQKTFASLLIVLAASVLAIAAAYIVGQRSAEYRIRDDMARSEARQQEMIEQLRRDLVPQPSPQPETAQSAITAITAPAPVQAEPEKSPETPNNSEPIAEEKTPESTITDEAPVTPAETTAPEAIVPAKTGSEIPTEVSTASAPDPPVAEANTPQESASETKPAEPLAPPIARDCFDTVALGVSYAEVAQKFGREGKAALTMEDAKGTQTKQYFWQWVGAAGEACRVDMLFVNGRLTDKNFRG